MARRPKVEDTTTIIDKEDHIINKEFIELFEPWVVKAGFDDRLRRSPPH